MDNVKNLKFPYYPEDKESRDKLLNQYIRHDLWDSLAEWDNNTNTVTLKRSNLGINYLWSFFNHIWADIKCGRSKTLREIFEDKKTLKKILDYHKVPIEKINADKLRHMLKDHFGTQFVSNFRPTAAHAIYDIFLEDFNATVWDPCAGFGGRMLGALKADKVKTYIGNDPSTAAYIGLISCLQHIEEQDSKLGKNIHLLKATAEEVEHPLLKDSSIDLVFTSPPYFDLEKYSEEDTQSYLKYPSYDEWLSGFMKTLCEKAYRVLKPGRKFILNINATPTNKSLHYDSLNIALASGFKLIAVHKYNIFSRYNNTDRSKFEPVFELEKN